MYNQGDWSDDGHDKHNKSKRSAQLGRCVRTLCAWLSWLYLWCIERFFRMLHQQFAWNTFGYLCASHEKGVTMMEEKSTAVGQCYDWNMPYGVSINGEKILIQMETSIIYNWHKG